VRHVCSCGAHTRVRVRPRARMYVRVRAKGTDHKDKEHFRADVPARGGRRRERERQRGNEVRVSVAAGKEKRRRTRGRVTPECPRFLLSVPSLLSPARSVPLALTRVPQSSPSSAGPLSPYLPPPRALSPDSPSPGYIISLFSLLPLSSPRTNGAHHLSSCLMPRRILRVQRMLFPIGTMESRSRKLRLAVASR